MGELGNRHDVVAGAVGSEFRIGYLEIDNAVNGKLGVVAGDTNLAGNVQRHFFERVAVGNAVNERNQDVQTGGQRVVKSAEAFNDVNFLLRHDDKGFEAENYDDKQQDDGETV